MDNLEMAMTAVGSFVTFSCFVFAVVKLAIFLIERKRGRLARLIVEATTPVFETLETGIHKIRHDVTPPDEIVLLISEQIELLDLHAKLHNISAAFHRADSVTEDRLSCLESRFDALKGSLCGDLDDSFLRAVGKTMEWDEEIVGALWDTLLRVPGVRYD